MPGRATRGSIDSQAGGTLPAPPMSGTPAARRSADRRGPLSRLSGAHKQQLAGWIFLTPAIAYVLFAFATPIVYNVALSFERDSLSTIGSISAPWAGLSNYTAMFNDQIAQSAIVHTLVFTVGSLAGQFIIGLSLALLFSNRFPGRTIARSLVIVPWLVPLIVTGVIFRFMFQQEGGAINQILVGTGLIHNPVDWLGTTTYALLTVTIANIWLGVPFFTLLLYSALQEVPAEVKEADRRSQSLAATPPRDDPDHPARYRNNVPPRVCVHREGVRLGDWDDRRRSGQRHTADIHMVLHARVSGV
jgi:multiple sugar transport system permease protein